MANFLAVVDSDPRRRRHTIRRVEGEIAPVDGLRAHTCRVGSFEAVWAVDPDAPFEKTCDSSGCGLIWGEAIAPGERRRIGSEDLEDAWRRPVDHAPVWDGYYAALRYRGRKGVVAGGDLLGLFPLYYSRATRDVLLVASSPPLVRRHPHVASALDLHGLAGLLVTGGPVKGRTLHDDVRRLGPGHLLEWVPGSTPRETQQFALEASSFQEGSSASAQVRVLHESLRDAVARHLGSERKPVLLLSGGRDSRSLLGAAREVGAVPRSLTFGRRDDYEFESAQSVARRAGVPIHRAEYSPHRYVDWALRSVRREELASSFAAMYTWGAHRHLRRLGTRVMSGHLLELVLGGAESGWFLDAENRPSFDVFFRWMNRHAVPLGVLDGLVRSPELRDAVDDIVAHIRESYHASRLGPARFARRFLFRNWGRFHAGSAPWRFSFGAWPVLPVLDRRLLTLGMSLPRETTWQRHAQDSLLRSRYPELASVPLDTDRREAVSPDRGVLRKAGRALRRIVARSPLPGRERPSAPERERRFYHRIYDLDAPGWRAVRRRAEPNRARLSELFQPSALERYLPPPQEDVQPDRTIMDSFGCKTLLGLMLWMETDAPR